jgi:hypothetical protein
LLSPWILHNFTREAYVQDPFGSLTRPKDPKLTSKLRQYDAYAKVV